MTLLVEDDAAGGTRHRAAIRAAAKQLSYHTLEASNSSRRRAPMVSVSRGQRPSRPQRIRGAGGGHMTFNASTARARCRQSCPRSSELCALADWARTPDRRARSARKKRWLLPWCQSAAAPVVACRPNLSNPSAARSLCATVRSRAPMIGFWGRFAWRSWRERRCVREVSRALTLLLRRWQLSSSACPGNAKGPPPVQRCDPSDGRSSIKAQRVRELLAGSD